MCACRSRAAEARHREGRLCRQDQDRHGRGSERVLRGGHQDVQSGQEEPEAGPGQEHPIGQAAGAVHIDGRQVPDRLHRGPVRPGRHSRLEQVHRLDRGHHADRRVRAVLCYITLLFM